MTDEERDALIRQLSREGLELINRGEAKLSEARKLQPPAPPDVQTSEQK